jgi:uncharacterized membrane protein YeaQ/YmgE (transglycosylase-associated protein family)
MPDDGSVRTMAGLLARPLILAGAAGVVASAFMPWVTVKGTSLNLDLGWIGATVSPGGKTVNGTDTSVWPAVVAVGGVVALLALVRFAKKLLILLGVAITLAGGGLLYYVLNVIDIETSSRSIIEQTVAGLALTSSAGSGPPLLLASGLAVLVGALLR